MGGWGLGVGAEEKKSEDDDEDENLDWDQAQVSLPTAYCHIQLSHCQRIPLGCRRADGGAEKRGSISCTTATSILACRQYHITTQGNVKPYDTSIFTYANLNLTDSPT